MIVFVITAFLSLIIILISLWLSSFRHPPRFHHERDDYVDLLKAVLSGQADYDQWSSIMHLPIRHDPDLEKIRQRCVEIEEAFYRGYPVQLGQPSGMFTEEGLKQLEGVLKYLQEDENFTA